MRRIVHLAAALFALLLGASLPSLGQFPSGPSVPSGFVTPDGSQGAWTVVNDQAFEGATSLGSAKVFAATQGGTPVNSDLRATGTFLTGSITFTYRISSHQSFGSFTFSIDGVVMLTEPGGESGWKSATFPVTAGNHTFRWRFTNTLNVACGTFNSPPATGGASCSDRAWVDALVMPVGSDITMAAATQQQVESTGLANIIVNRTGNADSALTVNFATSNGTALVGTHFGTLGNPTQLSGTLTWAACDTTPKTITVPLIDNAAINTARIFTVTLSSPSAGGSLPGPSATVVTINDDDNALQFNSPTFSVTEGTATVTIGVARVGSGAAPASVTWTTGNGTAIAGQDFGTSGSSTQHTGTLNWAGGDGLSKSFTVPILNDALMESAETFNVVLSNPTGLGTTLGSPATATVTINDNDTSLSFAQATYTVAEGGPNITVSVNRIGSTTNAIGVTWTTANATALAGQDFGTLGSGTQRTGTLSWPAGDATPRTLTVGPTGALPILNDATFESNESFTITLSAPTGGASLGATPSTTVTITDDESTIQFSGTTLTVGETGANGTLTLTRTGSIASAASVNFTTVAGTATAASDFTQTSGTINWAAGDGASKTIAVGPNSVAAPYIPILNDAAIETPETFTVVLSTPTGGGVIGVNSTATVTINSEDAGVMMAVVSQSVGEAAGPATVVVNRFGSTAGAISVSFTTANGTAVAGTDYTLTAGTLNWAAGDGTSKQILVPIIDNLIINGARAFDVNLSAPVGAVLGAPSTTTVSITDNDNTLQFTAATAAVTEGTPSLTLTVSRLGLTTGTASVTWATANGTASAGNDFGTAGVFTPVTGTVNWAAGDAASKTITIPIINNSVLESAEVFTVNLSAPTGPGANLGTPAAVTVTINDDESVLEFSGTTLTVGETGANGTLTLTRTGSTMTAASVTYTTVNASATSGTDFGNAGNFAAVTGVVTWAVGDSSPKTLTVGPVGAGAPYIAILNDAIIEGPETFNVVLSAPTGGGMLGVNTTAIVTVISEDAGIAMATGAQSVSENAGTVDVLVTRAGSTAGAIAVSYSVANVTALNGTHFTSTAVFPTLGTLNWASGDGTPKTISIPIIDDSVANTSRTFTVNLSNPVGAVLGTPTTTTVTITDDDNTLQITAATASVTEGAPSVLLTVSRLGGTAGAASVTWTTANGTATSGSDFGALGVPGNVTGTLNWLAGDAASKTITIPILDDAVIEATEAFTVTLSAPTGTGASVGTPSTATVSINDDEVSLNFAQAAYSVVESGPNITVTVNRSGATTNAIGVTWTTGNGSAVAGQDFGTNGNPAQRTGTLSWAAGDAAPKTLTVGPTGTMPILNDTGFEADETFTITLSAPTGGAALGPTFLTTVTISDDESTIQFSGTTLTVGETGVNATLTLTRTGSTATAASVTYATVAGTAAAATDFTQTTGTITWGVGDNAPKTIAVGPSVVVAPYIAVLNDALIESPETFTVVLSAPTGGGQLGASTTATITINSDDIGIAMATGTQTIAEAAGTVDVIVNRAGSSTGAISVNFTTANGTALAGTHYTLTSGTLNWASGDGTPKTITVPIIDNAAVNANRTFNVTLSGPVGAALGTPATTTVTIADDDNTLQFTAATATVTEGTPSLTLTVTRVGGTAGTASVTWTTANGTAVSGSDFGVLGVPGNVTGTLNWAAGDATSKTITIPILNDAIAEATETFTVNLSAPTGAGTSVGTPSTATVTLSDDEVSLNFEQAAYSVLEVGANVTVSVTRSGATTNAVGVTWTTGNGTAIAGQDFGTSGSPAQRTGTLSWAAGDTAAKIFTVGSSFPAVPILNDTAIEGNETFTITLSAPTGGAIIGPTAQTTITITDDDSTIEFGGTTLTVGETGPNGTLSVTRTGAITTALSVNWTTVAGTATVGSDFTSSGGSLSWAAGDGTPKTIAVGPTAVAAPYIPIVNDAVIESPETFTVVLSSPTSGGVLGANTTATVTINSEDTGIAMATGTQTIAEAAGTVDVIVNRAGSTTGAISVNFTTVNGTALSGTHYTLTSGTLNWASGDGTPKTITVPITDDTAVNANRTFNVTLSGPVGAALGTPATTTVTIADDDNTLQFTAATATVTEGTPNLTLTVSRLGGTAGTASVTWTTANGTATSGSDFGTLGVPGNVTGTLNWAAGDAASKTITIPILNDAVIEASETFTVNLSAPVGTGVSLGATATATVTVNDDDAGLSFAQATYSVVENGPNITVTVNRTGSAASAVGVTWTTGNGSAIAGQDFGTSGNPAQRTGTLSWAAGDATPKTFTVGPTGTMPIINDTAFEPDETFTITLSAPTGGAALGAISVTTVTITDDEATIQFAGTTLTVGETGANGTLTVTRTGSTASAASVNFTTVAGTATAASDFTQTTGTLTWAAGDGAPKTIAVGPVVVAAPYIAVLNDALIEAPETFTVVLSAPTGGAQLGVSSTATVTITSEDTGIAMAAAAQSVAEGAGTVIVSVNRAGSTTGAISVNFATSNGTALAGTHYTTNSGTLNWADGDGTPKTITISIADDGLVNTSRTFSVTLSGPVGASLGTPSATVVTIADDDNTLQFTAATATVAEGTANLTLTVSRVGGPANPASVTWTTANGTALSGSDFGTLGVPADVTGTLNWAAADAASKTVSIPILNDAIVEGAKTFTVTLSAPTGATLGAIQAVSVTLSDNDAGLVFSSATYTVNENGATVTLTVSRIGPTTAATGVTWTTANGTAISGTDFGLLGNAAQRTGTLAWVAGDATSKTFTVAVLNDALIDGNKSFTVALSAPTGGLVLGTPSTATVTILDDETAPESTLQFSAVKYLVSEAAGPVVLTVTRTGSGFTFPVSVNFAMTAGSAVAGGDYTASSGTLSWASGDSTSKTITIPITNDAVAESPEQFTVTLSAAAPGAGLGTPATATVEIIDDDEPWPPLGGFPAGWTVPGGATAGWHVSNDPTPFDGVFVLKTDAIDDGQTAQVEVTGTFVGGTLTFRVRVSSELNFDFMRFYVDGVKMGEWSGTANNTWQLVSVPVAAGVRTFRWSYEKDASGTIGQDAAWIDAVVTPPPGP